MNTPTLETKRLRLRKFTGDDLDALFLILKDEAVNKFLPWYPMKNIEETRKFYQENYAAKYEEPQAYAYAICLKSVLATLKLIWRTTMISVTDFARSSGIRGLLQRPVKRLWRR